MILLDKDISIYVCFHKEDLIPLVKENIKDNPIYKLLFLGEGGRETNEYLRDDTGDNISHLNLIFSELTGLYWMWKNSPSDIIGLDHYRRYFSNKKYFGRLLTKEDILNDLENHDIILVKKNEPLRGTNRKTFEEWDEYFDITIDIIKEVCPEYEVSFRKIIDTNYPVSFFNMFICEKEILDGYCEWVFPILFKMLDYDIFLKNKMPGYICEFFLTTYAYHNNLKVAEEYVRWTDTVTRFRMFFAKIGILRRIYKFIYKLKNE